MNKLEFVCDLNECQLYLENPIFLSCCGTTICKKHVNDFEINDEGKFKCPICSQLESIPKRGFPMNNKIMNLIQNGDLFGEIQKKALNSIPELESKIKERKSINTQQVIKDYFKELRYKVRSNRKQIIKKINKESHELFTFLKKEEEKCKEDAKKSKLLEDFNTEKLSKWKNLLRKPDFKDDQAEILLNKINDKINQINYDISNYKNVFFSNRKVEFVPFKIENYLGEIEIKPNNFKISYFRCMIKKYSQHQDCVRSIQIIQGSSNKFISASDDKTIKIWDLQSGECLKTLNEHSNWVTSVLIYKNNKFISGSFDETIKVWDLESFKCIETLNNNSAVWCLLLLSDNFLASALADGRINVWNLNEKRIEKSINAHDDWICCLIKTKDSSKLISGSGDSTIKIWDLNRFELLNELSGHLDQICFLKILNDESILSGSLDKTIKIWEIDSGECLKTINFNCWVNCVETFNEDKMLIIGIGTGEIEENDVIIYDLEKNEELKKINSVHSSYVSSMNLLSNGNLLTSSGNGEIKLWNLLK